MFQEDHLGFSLTDRNLEYNINSSDLILSTERQEISYDRFDEDPETIYYWKLPHQFLGNKVNNFLFLKNGIKDTTYKYPNSLKSFKTLFTTLN